MRGTVWGCILATSLPICLTAHVRADTITDGSAMPMLSYSSAVSGGTTTYGSNNGTTAQFKTDGYAGEYIQVTNPAGAAVSFTLNAAGVSSGGVNPDMTISIADYQQSFNVSSSTMTPYQYTTPVLPMGTYLVRAQMDNQAGTVTPQLNLGSVSVGSTATVLSGNTDANALNAANTYIQNFRQGAETVSTGFASGTQLNMKLVRNAFSFGSYVPGFNQSDVSGFLTKGSTFESFLSSNFNLLVPANAGKWSFDESKTGSSTTLASGNQFTVTMGGPDLIMAYAKSHHMVGRMHNLLWSLSSEDPGWVTTELNNSGTGAPTANLMSAITNRIGYYVGGGDKATAPAGTTWTMSASTPYPKNQLNIFTNDVRANDITQMDILNEPFHKTPFYSKLGPGNTAYIYYQAQQAAAAAGANTRMYANEYNVMQNSPLSIDPTTGTQSGSDVYSNWYQQYVETLNNQTYNVPNVGNTALGKVVTGVGIEWYPTGSGPTPSGATMEQSLQNLSVLGLPISIGEAGIQSSISTTNGTATVDASNVKTLDDTMRILYGTPGVDTFTLWGWLQSQTDSMGSSSVLYNDTTTGTPGLTAAGTRFQYLMGTGVDPKAVFYSFDQANADGSNPHPFNTPTQNVTVNSDGSVHFNGDYGLYELDGTLNGNPFRFATVDFEKGANGATADVPVETLWVKGDFDLNGKLDNGDLQAMLAALQNQNRVIGGALVLGYQASHNMSNDEFLAICDINDDGVFDAKDISVMEQLLASGIQAGNGIFDGGGSVSTVPEPASIILSAISLLWLICCNRPQRKLR